ncbi:hypothetical protein NKG94_38005 [Micromonospora sp. M12]
MGSRSRSGFRVRWAGRAGPAARLGVVTGSVVGTHYDSMVAKLVAWGRTRAEATRLLAGALSRAELHGVTTNRDLLVRVLRSPAFAAVEIDTGFLDRHAEVFARCCPPIGSRWRRSRRPSPRPPAAAPTPKCWPGCRRAGATCPPSPRSPDSPGRTARSRSVTG